MLVLYLGVLNDVHELTKSIQTGEAHRAAELASKLAYQGVQLTKKNINQDQSHNSLRYADTYYLHVLFRNTV